MENMAAMVAYRKKEAIDYLLEYNPVCFRHAEELKKLTGIAGA